MSIGAESSVKNLTRVRLAVATAVTLAALSLAACGGDSSSSSSAAPASTPASTPASGTTSTTTGTTSATTTTTASSGTSGKTTTTTTTGTSTPATGSSSGSTTTSSTPSTVKSIKQWVSCSETIDESGQLAAALTAAAHNAFVLQVDCPVRFHTGKASLKSISVPEGVTVKFTGAGEFLTVGGGPPALEVDDPKNVTFVDYNQIFL